MMSLLLIGLAEMILRRINKIMKKYGFFVGSFFFVVTLQHFSHERNPDPSRRTDKC